MKKTQFCLIFLLGLSTFSFSQKIVLVNGEAVKVKIEQNEVVEIVDTKLTNYMNEYDNSKEDTFQKENSPKIIRKDDAFEEQTSKRTSVH